MPRLHTYPLLILLLTILSVADSAAQEIRFRGQASAWTLANTSALPIWAGGRYIPELNLSQQGKQKGQWDFQAAGNMYGLIGTHPFDSLQSEGGIKPYRLWVRYSLPRLEVRAGLQKINFGSASLLRPLMWFDRLDPRDPLQLTDGVWGLLGRYYFLNNANIWLWALYGNEEAKTWDLVPTSQDRPELGGRLQLPALKGELGFSFHHRLADFSQASFPAPQPLLSPENRMGLDGRWDKLLGFWMEAVWIQRKEAFFDYTHQHLFNMGADYTFPLGAGLHLVYEQLLTYHHTEAFHLKDPFAFSLLSANYPLGLADQLSALVYYDWNNAQFYQTLTWQHQFSKLSLYVLLFHNPETYALPLATTEVNLFAGSGLQLMLVYHHQNTSK